MGILVFGWGSDLFLGLDELVYGEHDGGKRCIGWMATKFLDQARESDIIKEEEHPEDQSIADTIFAAGVPIAETLPTGRRPFRFAIACPSREDAEQSRH